MAVIRFRNRLEISSLLEDISKEVSQLAKIFMSLAIENEVRSLRTSVLL